MSRRAFLLGSASATALFAAMPVPEPVGWYGAVDAGWHTMNDFDWSQHDPRP